MEVQSGGGRSQQQPLGGQQGEKVRDREEKQTTCICIYRPDKPPPEERNGCCCSCFDTPNDPKTDEKVNAFVVLLIGAIMLAVGLYVLATTGGVLMTPLDFAGSVFLTVFGVSCLALALNSYLRALALEKKEDFEERQAG